MTILLATWCLVALLALLRCQIEATNGEAGGPGWRLLGCAACVAWPVVLVPLAAYAYASRRAG